MDFSGTPNARPHSGRYKNADAHTKCWALSRTRKWKPLRMEHTSGPPKTTTKQPTSQSKTQIILKADKVWQTALLLLCYSGVCWVWFWPKTAHGTNSQFYFPQSVDYMNRCDCDTENVFSARKCFACCAVCLHGCIAQFTIWLKRLVTSSEFGLAKSNSAPHQPQRVLEF